MPTPIQLQLDKAANATDYYNRTFEAMQAAKTDSERGAILNQALTHVGNSPATSRLDMMSGQDLVMKLAQLDRSNLVFGNGDDSMADDGGIPVYEGATSNYNVDGIDAVYEGDDEGKTVVNMGGAAFNLPSVGTGQRQGGQESEQGEQSGHATDYGNFVSMLQDAKTPEQAMEIISQHGKDFGVVIEDG